MTDALVRSLMYGRISWTSTALGSMNISCSIDWMMSESTSSPCISNCLPFLWAGRWQSDSSLWRPSSIVREPTSHLFLQTVPFRTCCSDAHMHRCYQPSWQTRSISKRLLDSCQAPDRFPWDRQFPGSPTPLHYPIMLPVYSNQLLSFCRLLHQSLKNNSGPVYLWPDWTSIALISKRARQPSSVYSQLRSHIRRTILDSSMPWPFPLP